MGSLAHELTTCQKEMTTVGLFHPVVQHHPKWFSPKLHKKRNNGIGVSNSIALFIHYTHIHSITQR